MVASSMPAFGDEVAAAQIVEVREVFGKSLRRAHQHFAVVEVETLAEGRAVRRGFPARRVVDDELADLALDRRRRMPDARTDEAAPGLQVHVEQRRLDLPPARMHQARALPGLVRRLVVREARVALDAVQRAADRPGIDAIVRADFRDDGHQVGQQALERGAHVRVVFGLVLQEPRAVVVTRQAAQELQARFGEIGRHDSSAARCRPQSSRASRRASFAPWAACAVRNAAISAKKLSKLYSDSSASRVRRWRR